MMGEPGTGGFNLLTPGWNANPETWQTAWEGVRIWLLGAKLDVDLTFRTNYKTPPKNQKNSRLK